MNSLRLPKTVFVDGEEKKICTDFQSIFECICALNDVDLTEQEKVICVLELYHNPETIKDVNEAIKQAMWIISAGEEAGEESSGSNNKKYMDWEHDIHMIIPAVNRVLGYDCRGQYVHWWTFIAAYREIGECYYSSVMSVRMKRMNHKPLESYEKEFYRKSKKDIDLPVKMSKKEIEMIPEWARGVL